MGVYQVGLDLQHPRRTKLLHQPQPACAAGHMQPGRCHEHQVPVHGWEIAGCRGLCDLTDSCHCFQLSTAQRPLHAGRKYEQEPQYLHSK